MAAELPPDSGDLMSKFFLAFILAAIPLAAQKSVGGQGHVYFGLNGTCGCDLTDLKSFGAGGDGFVYKGLALGGDLGYHFTRAQVGFGLASGNASYHFGGRVRSRKLVPFVTGGYGVAFREGSLNLYNFGGGVTYWFRNHLGARFEVREYRDQVHFLTAFRVGLTFR
jgi:hypothetical protein